MANASNTANVPDGRERNKQAITKLLTGIVGKTILFVVALLVFGYLVDILTQNTAATGVLIGMAYSLAGLVVLIGIVVTVVGLIRRSIQS